MMRKRVSPNIKEDGFSITRQPYYDYRSASHMRWDQIQLGLFATSCQV